MRGHHEDGEIRIIISQVKGCPQHQKGEEARTSFLIIWAVAGNMMLRYFVSDFWLPQLQFLFVKPSNFCQFAGWQGRRVQGSQETFLARGSSCSNNYFIFLNSLLLVFLYSFLPARKTNFFSLTLYLCSFPLQLSLKKESTCFIPSSLAFSHPRNCYNQSALSITPAKCPGPGCQPSHYC